MMCNYFDAKIPYNKLMIHALGGKDRKFSLLNSVKIMGENYVRGARFFEVDISLTSDGIPVLQHRWGREEYKKRIGLESFRAGDDDKEYIPSYEEFMRMKNYGSFNMSDVKELYVFLKAHSGAYIMIDVGEKGYEDTVLIYKAICKECNWDADVLNRLIAGGRTPQMIEAVRRLYDFPWINAYYAKANRPDEYIHYEDFLDWCATNSVKSFSFPADHPELDKSFFKEAHDHNLITIPFSANNGERLFELLRMGADIVGSDYMGEGFRHNDSNELLFLIDETATILDLIDRTNNRFSDISEDRNEADTCNRSASFEFVTNLQKTMEGFEITSKFVSGDQNIHYLVMNAKGLALIQMLETVALIKEYYSGRELYYEEEKYGKLLKKPWIIKKIVVITLKENEGYVKCYNSVDNIILLDRDKMDAVSIYAKSRACVHNNLHRDRLGSDIDRLDDSDKYKLFQIPTYYWFMELPPNLKGKYEYIQRSIALSENSNNEAERVLKNYATPADKTCVLSIMKSEEHVNWEEIIKGISEEIEKSHFTLINADEDMMGIDVIIAMASKGSVIITNREDYAHIVKTADKDYKLIVLDNHSCFSAIAWQENNRWLLTDTGNVVNYAELGHWLGDFYMGSIQRERSNSYNPDYAKTKDLNLWVDKTVNTPHLKLFFTVYDSADKYWGLFPQNAYGISIDISDVWRRSFIAVYDTDLGLEYEFADNNNARIGYFAEDDEIGSFYVVSRALSWKYTKCAVVINGVQYALQKRGLNIVVFDKTQKCVTDSINIDLWGDKNLNIRRRS